MPAQAVIHIGKSLEQPPKPKLAKEYACPTLTKMEKECTGYNIV